MPAGVSNIVGGPHVVAQFMSKAKIANTIVRYDAVRISGKTGIKIGHERTQSAVIGIVNEIGNQIRPVDISKYRHLIFATHGILDTDLPYIREPALVLAQVGNGPGADGFLTMSEVMELKLDAEVAALTACRTGLGREVSGEGVMGLGRAFQYSGARNVLVSLWSVAEQSTTLLTETFFRGLKEGRTPREAVRRARAAVRAAGYEHPFFWAPFILIGQ